ncbi:hypothetical protein EMIT047CA2_180064 [Pseudomonas soli]
MATTATPFLVVTPSTTTKWEKRVPFVLSKIRAITGVPELVYRSRSATFRLQIKGDRFIFYSSNLDVPHLLRSTSSTEP